MIHLIRFSFLQGATKARSSSLTSRKPLDHDDVQVRIRSAEVSNKKRSEYVPFVCSEGKNTAFSEHGEASCLVYFISSLISH